MTDALLDLTTAAASDVPPAADPVARIYGQPILDLPTDLYIPPDALAVVLDSFEGPLDLLLYLIRKANIDILDIPMAPLTAQYLVYVETLRERNFELAAEYLVMAAMLIEIKSRMLLPRHKIVEDGEVDDPRAELVRRLVEYEQMKLAAQALNEVPHAERDFAWVEVWVETALTQRQPEVCVADLQAAWSRILGQARLHRHHRVQREELSVREHMGLILRQLRNEHEAGVDYVEFDALFTPDMGVASLVVHFLAMLELAREKLISLAQTEAFAPIYLKLGHSDDRAAACGEEADDVLDAG